MVENSLLGDAIDELVEEESTYAHYDEECNKKGTEASLFIVVI